MKNINAVIKIVYLSIIDTIFNVIFAVYKIYWNVSRRNKDKNRVLVLTNDHIGDAVVRIGYFEEYKKLYGEDNVYFLASNSNKDIINIIASNIIVYNASLFRKSIFYKFLFMIEINKHNFTKIIAVIPYERFDTNKLCNLVLAKNEVFLNNDDGGCQYVLNNLTELYNKIANSKYSNDFFRPKLKNYLDNISCDELNLGENYVVLGMGADSKQRMYPATKFVSVLKFLISQKRKIVFLGNGIKDENYFKEISELVDINNEYVVNLIGKTSMVKTLEIIRYSKIFLGVESGLWNCAYALEIPSIVLYGGGHYGRFMHKDESIHYVFIPLECYECKWVCKYLDGNLESAKCIRNIEPDQIISALTETINK